MAKFVHGTVDPTAAPIDVSPSGRTAFLNPRKTVNVSIVSTKVEVRMDDERVHTHQNRRAVIHAPHGAKVLPYFQKEKECYLVMVEQFRIALLDKTVEPPGGEADESDIRRAMARELEEEAHVRVNPKDIVVAYSAYIQPSTMVSKAYGGIVRIKESQLPKELLGGEHQFGEYTVLSIRSLVTLLLAKDEGRMVFDLETCLLLDAVARAVGLVTRNY